MKKVFLGIGTNLNNRESNLKEAVAMIEKHIGKVVASSSVYETEPWGFQTEEEFLNMVVKVETNLNPYGLIGRILMIESMLGRIRLEKQYASRVIDIDILFYDDLVINETNLQIPHPLMHKRQFVLVPLCEIEPEMVHPVLKKSVSLLLESCEDKSRVRPQILD
jgi:2-amino-4-hydroxy-6-hydroxymethyldihydropteridine diphosphokinase